MLQEQDFYQTSLQELHNLIPVLILQLLLVAICRSLKMHLLVVKVKWYLNQACQNVWFGLLY